MSGQAAARWRRRSGASGRIRWLIGVLTLLVGCDGRSTSLPSAAQQQIGQQSNSGIKKPTDPVGKDDVPYVTGRARIVGRTKTSQISCNFIGIGNDGERIRGFSQPIQHGFSAAWTDQNAPQVSSIREDGDDHVVFQHARLQSGKYLFLLEVSGSDFYSRRVFAWKEQAVTEQDEIKLEMDIDLTQVGSVEVTVPESVCRQFKARYDAELKRRGTFNDFGFIDEPILPIKLIPSELSGHELMDSSKFWYGKLPVGESSLLIDGVPAGTYIASCRRSQAEITVTTGRLSRISLKEIDSPTNETETVPLP